MRSAAVAAIFAFEVFSAPHSVAAVARAVRRAESGTPVERVVNLLTDLKQKLEFDEKVEEKVYSKYACWCEKTTARKAQGITDASTELRAFGQTILSLKGLVATRGSEIAELETDIKENQEAQARATSLRQKENSVFVAETAELKQAIAALEKAVTVLVSGTKPAAFLQESTKAQLRSLFAALPVSRMSTKSGNADQIVLLSNYLTNGAKYMPQSFTVQGILKDMYETFASDLESATQAEATGNTNFEALIAGKTVELKEMFTLKEKKEGEKAEAEQRLADTQAMYDDTAAQKQADVAFFDETKAACQNKHDTWSTRSELRAEELEGISKALEILSSDDARKLFATAIKAGKETGADDKYNSGRNIVPALLQVQDSSSPSEKAYAALKQSATKGHSLRLAALAAQVRTAKVGHFSKVLFAIDNVIKTLEAEEAEDIQKRDHCKNEYQSIESTVNDLDWKIEKNGAKIDKLSQLIELRTQQKAQTVDEINEVEAHMAAITAERKADNEAFLQAKLEDQQAIDLLMSARAALAKFYEEHDIDMGKTQGSVKGVFSQQEPEFAVSEDQAPDAEFSNKGHRKAESKGIVSILTMIIEDLDDEIKNGMKAEGGTQLAYEAQMTTAQQLHGDLVAKKLALETAIAKRSEDRSDELQDKEANEASLDSEHEYKKIITPDCDFVIRTFSKRADARRAEMGGLRGAKEFLAGYQPGGEGALLETTAGGKAFDDAALSRVGFLGLHGR